jgi:hypothetical protein
MLFHIITCYIWLGATASVDYSLFGFGANRLKLRSSQVGESTSCTNVEVFRYTEAVIDNFAPIEKVLYFEYHIYI